jgi:potassium large conductance calcium-activated channel subfamily M alpha protein 1
MISKIKKDIFIVVELINPKNVSFLYNKGREQNDEYRFIKANMNIDGTASFASGEVYFSSIMDNIIIQAYYNPSLLAVIKKLILGEDQSVYKKAPLSRYKDISSANLYIIDLPEERKTDIENTTTRMQENDIFTKKQTFKEVFQWFLKQKIIVIGVYRAIEIAQNRNHTFNNTFSRSSG